MKPPDREALEAAAWAAFLARLADHLAGQWPALQERLGDKLPAFVELSAQQALQRGLTQAAAVARWVNLSCVWGPAFHDKPGFEWAAGILASSRGREWPPLHQLLRRSLIELSRLPDARVAPAVLEAADTRLLDTFAGLGRLGAMRPPEPLPTPRAACDLEALELRLQEPAVTQQYVFADGQWRRAPLALPAPLRVDATNAMPRLAGVLAQPPGVAPQARVQLRSRSHATCSGDVHPALDFAGTHGLWQWTGHETRAVSWPVCTLAQPEPGAGPGTAVAEETSPDIFRLDLRVCGLRDEGEAVGSVSTQLWAWPAAQWFVDIERRAAEAQPVLAARAPVRLGNTRSSVERDGVPLDAQPLRGAFEQGLDPTVFAAQQALLTALDAVPGLSQVRLEGALALLVGRAVFTWGWALGPAGMNGRAFLRLLGALDMQACQADLHAEAELALAGGRARLRLHCVGTAALATALRREAAEPPLLAAMMPARIAFRLPFTAQVIPLATDQGALLQSTGPCTGALAGEAGLRPRLSGGSGFEWFASLRLEAAVLPLALVDPGLGSRSISHELWPARPLFDWSLC